MPPNKSKTEIYKGTGLILAERPFFVGGGGGGRGGGGGEAGGRGGGCRGRGGGGGGGGGGGHKIRKCLERGGGKPHHQNTNLSHSVGTADRGKSCLLHTPRRKRILLGIRGGNSYTRPAGGEKQKPNSRHGRKEVNRHQISYQKSHKREKRIEHLGCNLADAGRQDTGTQTSRQRNRRKRKRHARKRRVQKEHRSNA